MIEQTTSGRDLFQRAARIKAIVAALDTERHCLSQIAESLTAHAATAQSLADALSRDCDALAVEGAAK